MGSRIDTGLVLDALLMALWRRQPTGPVTVHSDQGSQFTGHDWQDFLRDHNLVSSMSRRGNCHDNAVAESFFQLLKRERIRRQIYPTRDDVRADVFNYIEMFYNRQTAPRHCRRYFTGRVRETSFSTAQLCLGKPGRFNLAALKEVRLQSDLERLVEEGKGFKEGLERLRVSVERFLSSFI